MPGPKRTRHVGGTIRVQMKAVVNPSRPILDAVIVKIRENPNGRQVTHVRITSPSIWQGMEIESKLWNVAKASP